MNPFAAEILEYLGAMALGVFIFFFPDILQAKRWSRSFTGLDRIIGKIGGVFIVLISLSRICGVIADAIATLF